MSESCCTDIEVRSTNQEKADERIEESGMAATKLSRAQRRRRSDVLSSILRVMAQVVYKTGELGDEVLLRKDRILFAFIARRDLSSIIHASWVDGLAPLLEPGKIYVRTSDGVYRTMLKTLCDVGPVLGEKWQQVHQSVIVNMDFLEWAELKAKNQKQAGFNKRDGSATGAQIEAVAVSDRFARALRERLGCLGRLVRRRRGPVGTSESNDER